MEQGLGRLRNNSAVVTGAAKGIGRATAELFAREGDCLVVTDVDEEGLGALRYRLAEEVSRQRSRRSSATSLAPRTRRR